VGDDGDASEDDSEDEDTNTSEKRLPLTGHPVNLRPSFAQALNPLPTREEGLWEAFGPSFLKHGWSALMCGNQSHREFVRWHGPVPWSELTVNRQ
jgi:hypothetical protein